MSKQHIPRVPETIDFPKAEVEVLTLWEKIDAFETSLKQSKEKPRYTFFDGPPFATGLPHYGHILAGTIKDVVTRYAHQQGFHVERRFGWDCHGLPVEYEIDIMLNIKGPDDVIKMGIDKYNNECRNIVGRYSSEWEIIMTRLGRWIDFKNDYKSMYPWYMESIWWIFKQLYDKGLVYQGNKVMPYSTACNTPLSNFESGQNYKDVIDPAVTVSLPIINDEDNAALLIWTTTPWTLPSNLAACVNPNLKYARIFQRSTNKCYIILEERIVTNFSDGDFIIKETILGNKLKGLEYEPIFPYYQELRKSHGAFKVLCDEYVTSDCESGTGIVHQAPYFGEDDYRVCLSNGIITKDMEPVCPLDASGKFIQPVVDFEGQYIKDADKNIINKLKENGKLFHQSQIKHSYPFCWRSDTPLIYRAVPSWFIRVEHMRKRLLDCASTTYWVPEFVRDKRFGNWLREARDWAVSRNRYWGTPIPIWASPDGSEIICVGSISELEELTGKKVTDLHREYVDHLEIPSCTPGKPPLKRIPEVFDCWFESGSMPYAQLHYPFENFNEFEEMFPADFIAEGIDQTRGWFYTLLVISTALFDQAPFKNLIANGMVLASDGQKMSKRKKNYPDPMEVVHKFGADALRLYLISSPVVRAENLRFKEEGVRDILKDVFLPWYNAFRFLFQNLEMYVREDDFTYDETLLKSSNIMDRWILSFTQSLLQYAREEMKLYHLFNVVPKLTKFIDYLTNWYVRLNRRRLKGDTGKEDCKTALNALLNVILNITNMMAPFAPFLSETMYQIIKVVVNISSESIHYLMLPIPNNNLIDLNIERAVSKMQSVIELGRVLRDRNTLPLKCPLREIIVIHQDPQYLTDILSLQEYILSELNIKKISSTNNRSKYGITLRAEPNYKTLGLRLKGDLKAVTTAIKALSNIEINALSKDGHAIILGHKIHISELKLIFKVEDSNLAKYEVNSDDDVVILLDCTADVSMQDEGTAREIVNKIQKLRKKAHLVPTDDIVVFYKSEKEIDRVAKEFQSFIEGTIKAPLCPSSEKTVRHSLIIEETIQLKGCNLYLALTKISAYDQQNTKWVNLYVSDMKPRLYNSDKGMILLEAAGQQLTLKELKKQIISLFGVTNFSLWNKNGQITCNNSLQETAGGTIFISKVDEKPDYQEIILPFCKTYIFSKGDESRVLILENPVGNVLFQESEVESYFKNFP